MPIKLFENFILEAKLDKQKLIDFAGEKLTSRFFSLKQRLKSPQNDIYYWLKKSPQELENALDEIESTKTRKQKSEEASKGAELVYQDKDWKVYYITTYEASVKYGKGTMWCISSTEPINGHPPEYYWNDYTNTKGIKFYFYYDLNNSSVNTERDVEMSYTPYAVALYPNGITRVYNQLDKIISGIPYAPHIDGIPDKVRATPLKPSGIVDGVLYYDGNEIDSHFKGKFNRVIIEDGVTWIRNHAFCNLQSLTSIKIPDSVTQIGIGAFEYCKSLKSIEIPNSVTRIDAFAFSFCTSLKSIEIPDSVTQIGSSAFKECTSLTSVKIPNNITEIDDHMFSFCTSLKSIEIPDSVTQIYAHAFDYCKSLTYVKIPDSVIWIADCTFCNCSSLISIEIPKGITEIWYDAFKGCTSLQDVYYQGNQEDWKNIDIKYGNERLLLANIHFNS